MSYNVRKRQSSGLPASVPGDLGLREDGVGARRRAETRPTPRLGRFRLLRQLGSGGMAEVYLASVVGAEGLEKRLVLKRIRPALARNPRYVALFVREAELALRLSHRNLVHTYAFERIADEYVIVMELVDGLDLRRVLAAQSRQAKVLDPGIACHIAYEVLQGLHYLHTRGAPATDEARVVHRDVSPPNVLLSVSGCVKLADFGVALVLPRRCMVGSQGFEIAGKARYMCPEYACGGVCDSRSDVYSVALLLVEMLTGIAPFAQCPAEEVLAAHRSGTKAYDMRVLRACPVVLQDVLGAAGAVDPALRPADAARFAAQLRASLRGIHGADHADALGKMVAEHLLQESEGEVGSWRESTSPHAAKTTLRLVSRQPRLGNRANWQKRSCRSGWGRRPLMQWLAVFGEVDRLEDVELVVGASVSADAERLLAQGLLRWSPTGRLVFPDIDASAATYRSIPKEVRKAMHRRVAALLWLDGKRKPAECARHLCAGGNARRAAEQYAQAAEEARTAGSLQEALRHYCRALELSQRGSVQVFRIRDGLVSLYRALGDVRREDQQLSRLERDAERGQDAAMLALAANRRARFLLDQGLVEGVDNVLKVAEQMARRGRLVGALVEALRLRAQQRLAQGHHAEALQSCDEALAGAKQLPTLMAARAYLGMLRSRILVAQGEATASVESLMEAWAVAQRLRLRDSEACALELLASTLGGLGMLDDATALLRRSIAIDVQRGQCAKLGEKLLRLASLYQHRREPQRAAEALVRALDVFEVADDPVARARALTQLVYLHACAELPERHGIPGWLRELEEISASLTDPHLLAEAAMARSLGAFCCADGGSALRWAEQALKVSAYAQDQSLIRRAATLTGIVREPRQGAFAAAASPATQADAGTQAGLEGKPSLPQPDGAAAQIGSELRARLDFWVATQPLTMEVRQ